MKTLIALLTALGLVLGTAAARGSGTGNLVVAELFAAGGNSGAPYANDYVELLNRGSGPVDVGGWSLQYASAASTTWQVTQLAGNIPAGGRYLVQLASGGTSGASLPAADATGTSNLAVTGGKIALVRSATALGCGATVGSCGAVAAVEDFVGYGTATDYEGSGAAPAPSATTALARAAGGCTDGDDNAADFAPAAPSPRNSASAAATCGSGSGSGSGDGGSGTIGVDVQPVLSVSLDRSALNFAGAVPGTTPAPLPEHVTVTSNDSSGYTLSVERTAFSPHDLPLGIALGGGAMAPVPVTPGAPLLLATANGPSAAAGDDWATSVGFASPLPDVPSGQYAATLTFTVIGR